MTSTDVETTAAHAPRAPGANAAGIVRYLTVVGMTFVALMVTLQPDVGFTAPPAAMLLFWTLQVAAGFCVLQSVLYLLTRRYGAGRVPNWFLVLLSGILGAVVLAPVFWLIGEGMMERWFGYPAIPDDEDADLIGVSVDHPLLEEFLDIVGPVTATWLLICLPRLHWLVPPLLRPRSAAVAAETQPVAEPAHDSTGPVVSSTESDPTADSDPAEPSPDTKVASPPSCDERVSAASEVAAIFQNARWCERLPPELGRDVIAVSSELQYLRVWTSRGCALILGAMVDVESEGGGHGLRVHRSWWVAVRHVVSVRRTASGAVCLMSDGRQVPVSRRRRAEVLGRFGDGVRYHVAGASEAVTDADLH